MYQPKSKHIHMNWAQTPYVRNGAAGIYSKLAIDGFVNTELFEVVKPYFEGYAQKEGKKTAIYRFEVINAILQQSKTIMLDGVLLDGLDYNIGKVLSLSEKSTNEQMVKLAKLYNKIVECKNFQQDFSEQLNAVFDNKHFKQLPSHKKIPDDIKWENIKIGNEEYTFDFNYGAEKSIRWDEVSHEDFHGVDIYRFIPKEKIPQLQQLLQDNSVAPKMGHYDEEKEWQPGFDGATFEPKKKNRYGY